MNTFHLIIASPDGNLFDSDAKGVSLRGTEGDLAILAGHIPFITAVRPCECEITLPDNTVKTAKVESGILSVADNVTTLLSGSFEFTA